VNPIINAQDTIVKITGEIIGCKVVEIGTDQIKYKVADLQSDILFGIDKAEVDKIVFANGEELVIDHLIGARQTVEMNSDQLFKIQKKNDIKLNFLSPMNSVLTFSYEKAIKPGASWEATLGIVGIGFDNPDDAVGFAMMGRYKFFQSPDYYLKGMRYAHILKGRYVAPELLFASYQGKVQDWNNNIEKSYSRVKFAVLINFGKQWVFDDLFLIDTYGGIGYGYTNDRLDDGNLPYPYIFTVLSQKFPLALSYGFRIGFLFKGGTK
jgi:hypothetical protein